jgi:hypothetical protein
LILAPCSLPFSVAAPLELFSLSLHTPRRHFVCTPPPDRKWAEDLTGRMVSWDLGNRVQEDDDDEVIACGLLARNIVYDITVHETQRDNAGASFSASLLHVRSNDKT